MMMQKWFEFRPLDKIYMCWHGWITVLSVRIEDFRGDAHLHDGEPNAGLHYCCSTVCMFLWRFCGSSMKCEDPA